jgi:hypothetical protein
MNLDNLRYLHKEIFTKKTHMKDWKGNEFPPVHYDGAGNVNCRCKITKKGKWILDPDACTLCINRKKEYDQSNAYNGEFTYPKNKLY